MRALIVVVVATACAGRAKPPTLDHHAGGEYVELAWHAHVDDRDWVHVTLDIDGTPFEIGMASGPDDDGSAPSGCKSAPDAANPAIQRFYCAAASRSYSATLEAGEVVVTGYDEWLEPHRLTTTVVRRVKVHGTKLHVLAYHAS